MMHGLRDDPGGEEAIDVYRKQMNWMPNWRRGVSSEHCSVCSFIAGETWRSICN